MGTNSVFGALADPIWCNRLISMVSPVGAVSLGVVRRDEGVAGTKQSADPDSERESSRPHLPVRVGCVLQWPNTQHPD
jgi:hypothetical protein